LGFIFSEKPLGDWLTDFGITRREKKERIFKKISELSLYKNCEIFSGMLGVLETFKRQNIQMGIASYQNSGVIESFLNGKGIDPEMFSLGIKGSEGDDFDNPNFHKERIMRRIMEVNGGNSGEKGAREGWYYVGDFPSDCLCAQETGYHPLGCVFGDYEKEKRAKYLMAAGAEKVFNKPEDILSL